MVAVILPDGGRGYLSKIFNDEWMDQYGFLERAPTARSATCCARRRARARSRRSWSSRPHQTVRDAITLLHEHGVSQLPVVSADDPYTIVGSVGERGLLKRAIDDPRPDERRRSPR